VVRLTDISLRPFAGRHKTDMAHEPRRFNTHSQKQKERFNTMVHHLHFIPIVHPHLPHIVIALSQLTIIYSQWQLA